jgi:hypothetical protein
MRSVTQYWPKRWRKRLSSSSAGAPEAMARPEAGAGLAVHDGSHDGLRHRPASLLPAVPAVGDFQLPPHMHALSTFCGAQAPPPVTRYASGSWMASWIWNGDRWAGTFPVGGATGGARTRQQAVTVATLLATPTEIAAAQAMTVIDEFAPDSAP